MAFAQRLHKRRMVVPPPPGTGAFKVAPRTNLPAPTLVAPFAASSVQGSAPDDVLFADGLRELAAGNAVQGRKFLFELIKNHPRSRHIPSAYIAFGDYFFDQAAMAQAKRFYQQAVRLNPTYPHLAYVRARLGWTELNLGNHQHALQELFRAVRGRPSPTVSAAIEHGLIVAYAHVGAPRRALAFFRRINRTNALALLGKLAQRYADQGKTNEAIFLFQELLRQQPQSSRACAWQRQLAALTVRSGARPAAITELDRALRLATKLARQPTSAPCARQIEDLAFFTATVWHHEAVKAYRKPQVLAQVTQLYAAYTRSFPRGRHAAAAGYYYAEAMWSRAHLAGNKTPWLHAAAAFRRAASIPGQSRARAAEARRAVRLARENAARF